MNPESKKDGELLAEFVATAHEAPFEEIVRRHGAFIHGVCLRMLGRTHDAEDATQAVFLVLARRAASLRSCPTVAGWLHATARNVCRNVQRGWTRQKRREEEAHRMTPSKADPQWSQIQPLLDDELGRLPEKYRLPLVLHYLKQETEEAIAREMGQKVGTISMWLHRGREMLRDRLVERGVTVSSVLLFGVIAENAASAAVSPLLVSSAVKAATLVAAGKAGAAAAVLSPKVTAMAYGGMKTMAIAKMKIAAAMVIAATLVGAGGAAAFQAFRPPLLVPDTGLSVEEFEKLRKECSIHSAPWATIPWKVSISEARSQALKEKKPIFMLVDTGNPLGKG
jgi:RNA polymerase sigma factor (sigma-70 family)